MTHPTAPRCFWITTVLILAGPLALPAARAQRMQGEAVDASAEFRELASIYFVPDQLAEFDATAGRGRLRWNRYRLQTNLSFNKVDRAFARAESNEFPGTEYDRDPELPFDVTFLSPRAIRLRFATRDVPLGGAAADAVSPMLAGPLTKSDAWQASEADGAIVYKSDAGEVRIQRDPWRIEIRNKSAKLVTRTRTLNDPPTYSAPTPFAFVRRSRDLGHSTAASFALAHDEKIFGCGESFTRLDKRGQKLNLYTRDGMGVQTDKMYKPVPFILSSAGYGMFLHTGTPVTSDFGHDFDEAMVLSTGDEQLDLFVFLGTPKQILTEYTAVTGRSPLPPLWSFGLWMSRITYKKLSGNIEPIFAELNCSLRGATVSELGNSMRGR